MLIVVVYACSLAVGAAVAAFFGSSVSAVLSFVCAAAVLMSLSTTGRFRTRMVPDFVGQLSRVAGSVAAGVAVPFFAIAIFDAGGANFRPFAGLVLALLIASIFADWTSTFVIRKMWARGAWRSRAVMIGSGQLANELAVELQLRPEYGVDLVDAVQPASNQPLAEHTFQWLLDFSADRLIIASGDDAIGKTSETVAAVRRAIGLGVPTFVVPRLHEIGLGLDSMSPDRARGYPLIRVQRSAHPTIALRIKRCVDVAVALTVLLFSIPLLFVIAIGVKATSSGPVLFRQPRVGQSGKSFEMLKFRSMHVSGNEHAEEASSYRKTPVGRLLRSTSLDELPQFVNVLKGDMTLVGPRPERLAFVEEGLRIHPAYADRHRMPMGMTGLAQVAGLRGEGTSVPERIKFDNLYIDQWSLGLDLQVAAKTLFAILLQTRYRSRERELETALTDLPEGVSLNSIVARPQTPARDVA
jgi:exopolysaccharide biosynthesis polyprenyl glycosylphosphotransferase